MSKKSKVIHLIVDAIIMVVLVFIDRISKDMASTKLKDQDAYVILKDVFELRYLENRGAAWSVFENQQILFLVVSSIFLLIILYALIKLPIEKKYYLFEIVLSVLAAGAVGNMIDRIIQGYVVDFFYFVLINFPIFNVADIYVTISCVFFGIILLFVFKEEDLNFLSLKKKNNE